MSKEFKVMKQFSFIFPLDPVFKEISFRSLVDHVDRETEMSVTTHDKEYSLLKIVQKDTKDPIILVLINQQ